MIAVEINEHFIIDKLGHAPGVLPIESQPNIGLQHFIKIVVGNNIYPALKTIFDELFKSRQFCLRNLGNIFTKSQTILAEIRVEIFGLVILPLKLLVLYTVLAKLYRTYLCLGLCY